MDIYNIPMAATYSWSFITGAEDLTAPAIVGRDPYPGQVDVLLRSSVVITFTEELRPDSLNQAHFILQGPYGSVPNTLIYDPSTFTVTLDPDTRLLPTTDYVMTVTGDVSDWAGNPLGADDVWTFSTQAEPP